MTFYTEEGTERYLTNLDLPPEEIKEIYGMRWSIEIFFREIKSYLKIERFIGKNLNAVLIQIFSTLMAYLLIALLKTFYKISILKVKRSLKYGIDPCYSTDRENLFIPFLMSNRNRRSFFYLFDQSSVEYGKITSILFDSVEFYKFF